MTERKELQMNKIYKMNKMNKIYKITQYKFYYLETCLNL
jgi:hypothetical protein|uniref:Uncharacterized protein n=1 Tax=viral metagenome TaxID=1070528 RepID=A0A6C0D490_9ZZZZ